MNIVNEVDARLTQVRKQGLNLFSDTSEKVKNAAKNTAELLNKTANQTIDNLTSNGGKKKYLKTKKHTKKKYNKKKNTKRKHSKKRYTKRK